MVTASPSTRKRALEAGLDLEALGRKIGRTHLAREDVDRAARGDTQTRSGGPSADHARYWDVDHAAFGPVREEALGRVGRIAAGNLGAANATIPQVTHHDRADMRAVAALRARMAPQARTREIRLTALAFHVAALARCLIAFPRVNASLTGEGTHLVVKDYVHVAIAVDTPDGLFVPVIRDADRKGLWRIAGEIGDLVRRAQAGKLKAAEMGGASMTISNLGGIGGTAFTPIVTPPELAILGLTRTETVQVWNGRDFDAVPMLPISLSYDHRAVNGADAARFARHFADLTGDPRRMMT